MRLTGTVTIVNSVGYTANSDLGRPCKCVLEIRKRGDGRDMIVISATITDIGVREYEYDVQSIAFLHTMFVNEGYATIEIKEPAMYVILRKCKSEELINFIDELKGLLDGNGKSTSASKKSNAHNEHEVPPTLSQEILTLRTGRQLKRPRPPEIRIEKSKRHLPVLPPPRPISQTIIKVNNRAKYPMELLPTTIEKIYIRGIQLMKIDRRFTKLQWLNTLDLSGNSIEKITVLARLTSSLQSLILEKNQIAEIHDDLFNAHPFQRLQHLDLSGNQLTKLPSSVVNLKALASLYISRNKISVLPYNWTNLQNLRILNVAENRLQFVPATLLYIHMTRFDMSGNPDLQRQQLSDSMDPDYVGLSYDPVPTLFEMAAKVVMNGIRPSEYGFLPSVTLKYLQVGKYCVDCGQKSLNYKIIKGSVLPSSFNRRSRPACEVYPALASCFVKKIICSACDNKYRNSRVSVLI